MSRRGELSIGVNILVKGTNNTVTDLDGKFTLSGVEVDVVLIVSHVVYQTQKLHVPVKYKLTLL